MVLCLSKSFTRDSMYMLWYRSMSCWVGCSSLGMVMGSPTAAMGQRPLVSQCYLGPPSLGVHHDVNGSNPVLRANQVPNVLYLRLSLLQMRRLRPREVGRDLPKATEPLSSRWDKDWLHPLHSAGSSCESCGIREWLRFCPALGKSLHLSEP